MTMATAAMLCAAAGCVRTLVLQIGGRYYEQTVDGTLGASSATRGTGKASTSTGASEPTPTTLPSTDAPAPLDPAALERELSADIMESLNAP